MSIITVEIGLDTGPGTYPRSDTYNEDGKVFEGWRQVGSIFFGASIFQKDADTIEEAREIKAKAHASILELYNTGFIRGGKSGIVTEEEEAEREKLKDHLRSM